MRNMSLGNLESIIKQTSKDNPLVEAWQSNHTYYRDFINALNDLRTDLTDKQIQFLLRNKLQLGLETYEPEKYYQGATEISVVIKFHRLQHEEFHYEKPVSKNSRKQPECTIGIEGFVFNIEAKCPDLSNLLKIIIPGDNSEKKIILGGSARIPNHEKYFAELTHSISESDSELAIFQKKNKDNTLKDFLCSAHEKFADYKSEQELNILYVALDDIHSVSDWFNYLVGNEGLFTPETFHDPSSYSRVDVVVLTNLLYRHKHYKEIKGSAWNPDEAFIIHSASPWRQSKKEDALLYFSSIIKSHTNALIEYRKSERYRESLGDLYDFSQDMLLMPHYKIEIEKDQRYYWACPIKHICFIVPGYPTQHDPQYSFVGELVCAIADMGVECSAITTQSIIHRLVRKTTKRPFHWIDTTSRGNSIDIYQPRCFSVSNFKLFGKSISALLSKRATVKTYKRLNLSVDALYAHFWGSGVVAGEIANKYNVPFFVATGESKIWVNNQFSSAYIQKRMKKLKGVISVSTKNKNESLNLGLGVDVPYAILPNAINTSKFKPLDRMAARELLNFPKDAFIISFVGAFIERKGPLRVLEAVRKLEDPAIKIIFIGDGPQKPEGDEVLSASRIPHGEVAQYLSASDVFVLPTLAEGCSNAIVEAMACGLPIISSDLEFNHDILDSGNSILINPNDIDSIAKAIYQVKEDPMWCEKLSLDSLAKVNELSIEMRAQKIIRFLNENIPHS